MKHLTEIGLKFGTDKAEYHQFTEFYEDYFAKVAKAHESPRILEIGILDGGSLKMYDEFFRGKAKIVGIDMQDKSYLFPHSDNVLCLKGDILKPETVDKCRKAGGPGYDIIIDDGNHTMEQQQKTLKNLWPMLKPGGYFIIEDLHTSGNDLYNPDGTTTTLAILTGLGEGEFLPSAYLDMETLKALEADMEICIVAKQDFPQLRTQQPRTSITSMIQKKMAPPQNSSKVLGNAGATLEDLPTQPATESPKSFTDIVAQIEKQTPSEPVKSATAPETPGKPDSAVKKAGMLTTTEPPVLGPGDKSNVKLGGGSGLLEQTHFPLDNKQPDLPKVGDDAELPQAAASASKVTEESAPNFGSADPAEPEKPKREVENIGLDELEEQRAKGII